MGRQIVWNILRWTESFRKTELMCGILKEMWPKAIKISLQILYCLVRSKSKTWKKTTTEKNFNFSWNGSAWNIKISILICVQIQRRRTKKYAFVPMLIRSSTSFIWRFPPLPQYDYTIFCCAQCSSLLSIAFCVCMYTLLTASLPSIFLCCVHTTLKYFIVIAKEVAYPSFIIFR